MIVAVFPGCVQPSPVTTVALPFVTRLALFTGVVHLKIVKQNDFYLFVGKLYFVYKSNIDFLKSWKIYLEIDPMFVTLLVLVPIIKPFPFITFAVLVLTEDGEMT